VDESLDSRAEFTFMPCHVDCRITGEVVQGHIQDLLLIMTTEYVVLMKML
jgi:hypothetical protein